MTDPVTWVFVLWLLNVQGQRPEVKALAFPTLETCQRERLKSHDSTTYRVVGRSFCVGIVRTEGRALLFFDGPE